MDRRSFLTGSIVTLAAPAIVKYANIMPVRSPPLGVAMSFEALQFEHIVYGLGYAVTRQAIVENLYGNHFGMPYSLNPMIYEDGAEEC